MFTDSSGVVVLDLVQHVISCHPEFISGSFIRKKLQIFTKQILRSFQDLRMTDVVQSKNSYLRVRSLLLDSTLSKIHQNDEEYLSSY